MGRLLPTLHTGQHSVSRRRKRGRRHHRTPSTRAGLPDGPGSLMSLENADIEEMYVFDGTDIEEMDILGDVGIEEMHIH